MAVELPRGGVPARESGTSHHDIADVSNWHIFIDAVNRIGLSFHNTRQLALCEPCYVRTAGWSWHPCWYQWHLRVFLPRSLLHLSEAC